MNRYIRTAFCLPFGVLKTGIIKLFHPVGFHGSFFSIMSPHTEITLDRGGKLTMGRKLRLRDGAKLRVRKGAVCRIGNDVSVNSNNMIACHESITIGDRVELAPNVQIYDHDHDFRIEGGIDRGKYLTSPVVIGNSVWIGANAVILRGTTIGNNCVIGAGCVIKGNIPAGTVVVQKKENLLREIVSE